MKRIFLLVMTAVMIVACASCQSPDSAQAREIAQPLIEASQELDVLFYGKGLDISSTEKDGKYAKVVSEDYSSVEQLKDKLNEVYTSELCDIIKNSTLKGSTSEHGTSYARYIDIDGKLYMHENAKVYFTHSRRYDFDSIVATNMTEKRIIFTVDTYTADIGGNYSDTPENIELKLLYDEAFGGWRLDTPTY